MKKKLSLLIVAFMALAAYAGLNAWRTAGDPEVVLDFTVNDWKLPETKVVDEGTFTNSAGYTIKIAGTTGNGYRYYSDNKYVINGQKGAYLSLPAFDFAVDKIEVVGRAGASGSAKQNIFVGDKAVSTETTGVTGTNVYEIDEAYQAAGNVYVLKVTSAHNTQITKINIYKKAESSPTTYTVAGAVLGGDGSETAGFFGTKWDPTNTANDLVAGEGGIYTKKYENLDLSVCHIVFKVATNHAWSTDGSTDYPSSNKELSVTKAGKYDLTITFNPTNKEVEAQLVAKETEPTITSMEIRGTFPGMSWDADGAVAMTQVAGSTTQWVATMENVVVEGKTYEYKAFANNATDGYQLPASGNNNFTFGTDQYPAGTYNLTFTANTQANTLTLSAQKVEDPEPSITSMEIRGTFPGMSWEADGAVAMTQVEGDPTAWTVTVENVEVEAKTYEYKAYANHETTGFQLPSAEDGNASFTFGTEEYPAGKYNLKFIADTKWNRFEMVPTKVTEPEPPTEEAIYYAVGVADLWGVAWAKADNNKLTKGEDGKYSLTKTGLTLDAGTYGYKVLKVVGETETWIPEGGGTEKLLTIEARAVYSVTLTLDATDPITADSYLAVATKTGEAGTDQPATITKVQICGATDAAWTNRIDFELNAADPNVYFNTLDATAFTDDVEFKLVVNEEFWKGIGEFEKIEDPHGLLDQTTYAEGNKNFILKNSDGVYKTYGFKAHWKENPDAGAGWSLEVLGIDKRETTPEPTTPDLIVVGNNVELFGKAWDTESTTNGMELIEGKYYRTYKNVQPQEQNIELKAYNKTNGSWFGNTKDGENVVFNMKAEGDFTVVLDVNADFTDGRVWIEGDNVEMITPAPEPPTPTEATYYAVGVKALWGAEWTLDESNKLTKGEDGKYSVTKTGLTLDAGTYGYKVLKVVGETQTWIPEGDGTEKLLTIDARAVYSVTLTLDATDPITADSYLAVATKTGEAGTDQPATITKVQICGATDAAWTNRIDFELNAADPNVYYNKLDATAFTDDVEFQLVINEKDWLGIGKFEKIEALEGLIDLTTNAEGNKNLILKNSNGEYKTYDFKAHWKENPNAGAGWSLEVVGVDKRETTPQPEATWTVAGDNTTLFGEAWNPAFTANDMVKQEDDTYKWEKTEQTLAAGTVKFKVVKNHTWDEAYPAKDYELAIPADGKYTVTITFDAEKKEVAATATKTGDVVLPDAEITSVQLPGDWGWNIEKGADDVEPKLVLTKGEDNTWTGVLDLTEVTTDQKFKLNVNKTNWIGVGELTLDAGELVSTELGEGQNFILKNETSGFQTYNITATWTPSSNAKAGWTLKIEGKDERPVITEPVYTLVGDESAAFLGGAMAVLEANNLEKMDEDFYKKDYTGINLEAGTIKVWVAKNGDLDNLIPATGFTLDIASAGVYDLSFTFHSDQNALRGMAEKKSDPIEITRMDIVGDFTGGWPNTETGDWSVAKAMTQDATNPAIWTLKVEDFKAEAKTYYYKATANGQYGVYELPASGNNNWVFGTEAYPAGKYDLLFTANTADNSLTVVPTLTEVETVILDEEETLAENEVLEVDEPFTSDEITVEDGQIITIEADEAGESLVPRRAFRALAASDITIQYKPEAGSDWQDAPVTVETNETGYQFEVTGAVATAINDRGFAIKANKAIVVTQVAVVTEVTPDPEPDATISKVEIRGSFNEWASTGIELAKQGETNTYTGVLDLTDLVANQYIKLVINGEMYLDYDKMTVNAPEGWVEMSEDGYKNIYLKNATTGFKTYTMTAAWTPSPDATAGWTLTIAGKDERGETPDATITKVEIRGSFNEWAGTGIELAKQGETNTYSGVLDLTELTADQNIKLVINGDKWLNYDQMTVNAPEGWVAMSEDGYKNIYLKNSTTGFKTYTMTAAWTPSPDATAGWTLTIAGKDERPAGPATISKVEIRGEFTNWSDGEGVELTKQGETNTYAGVLDLSEITADQAFKLVLNDKAIWLDYNHVELVAPEGWLSKEAGDVAEPAIILANATTGYKTYSVTATWSPSPDASANWKLEIAGKDVREPAPEPEANYYIVGSMTDWTVKAEDTYKLTLNEGAEAGVTEYMKTIDFAAGAEFKVVKVQGETQTWYPDGMGNNYVITNASNYTVYFRPNGDGGEGWHYGYIYAVDNNPTGINALKVAIQKSAEVYTINGQRVQNPTKGLYIVNGRKVVIK